MKRNNIKLFSFALMAATAFTACSDEFLEEKKNFDNVSAGIYDNFTGANLRIADIYAWSLPDVNSDANWKYNCTGNADDQSKSTEEYSGFSVFVNPENPMTVTGTTKVVDYFYNQATNIQNSPWGRIRNINDVIRGISAGSLSQEEKDMLLGQAYFFRAWCYYNMVKWYGGIPIITEVQDPVESSVTPRSSAKDCIQFICDDLDKAAEMLKAETTNGGWQSSSDWGRVTTGTALALKGRVLLLWASPLFNRTNDESRWKTAYEEIKASIPVIESCGCGLYQTGDNPNAEDFARMFGQVKNEEAVFVSLYNTVMDGDYQKNSNWEQGIRPSNARGGGGKEASAMLVDMFPMADGKRPSTCTTYTKLDASEYAYNTSSLYMNRDPRFYRTFAFPGVRWTFSGDPTNGGTNNNPYVGSDYELWNYVWYTQPSDAGTLTGGDAYGADNLLNNSKKGIYVRKRTVDADTGAEALYSYDPSNGFGYSAAPYMEIRFAEVLLNYAEAACGAGQMSEAVEQLKKIRQRVGYTGDCGLQANLSSDQAACMSAILYERQIELAYEGKRFDDLRRWMLYDGGTGQVEGAPATWTLTGWGGNTCTWLGFTPLNGQRRERIQYRVKDEYGVGGTTYDSDPLQQEGSGAEPRPKAVDLREDLVPQLEALNTFYAKNLECHFYTGDGYDSNQVLLYMNFLPRYYFLGFNQGAQNNNKNLPQTIGWEDYNNGNANGTFDPLAETVTAE